MSHLKAALTVVPSEKNVRICITEFLAKTHPVRLVETQPSISSQRERGNQELTIASTRPGAAAVMRSVSVVAPEQFEGLSGVAASNAIYAQLEQIELQTLPE